LANWGQPAAEVDAGRQEKRLVLAFLSLFLLGINVFSTKYKM